MKQDIVKKWLCKVLYGLMCSVSLTAFAIEAVPIAKIPAVKSVPSLDANQLPNAAEPATLWRPTSSSSKRSIKHQAVHKVVPPKVIQQAQQQLQQTQSLSDKPPALAEQAQQLQKHLQTIMEKEQALDQLLDYFDRLKRLSKTGAEALPSEKEHDANAQPNHKILKHYYWPH